MREVGHVVLVVVVVELIARFLVGRLRLGLVEYQQ
jgi:hypothetical protein